MFWHIVQKLPFTSQPIVAWKFCHVLHKIIRDGHPSVSLLKTGRAVCTNVDQRVLDQANY